MLNIEDDLESALSDVDLIVCAVPTSGFRQILRSINDINSKLGDDHPQLIRAKGFDHCFVKTGVDELFAHLVHAKNGRSLRVFSNAPGLQLYTSNFLNGPYPGKHGKIYKPRQAICLEPQAFPNAPRESNFPAAVLGVNEKYEHHMVYKFGVVDV